MYCIALLYGVLVVNVHCGVACPCGVLLCIVLHMCVYYACGTVAVHGDVAHCTYIMMCDGCCSVCSLYTHMMHIHNT